MVKPNFFIVGAPRCGTTALFEYLRKHPEIYMPPEKELCFFGRDIRPKQYPISKYASFFKKGKNKKRVGEADTLYLYSKSAAQEIKSYCPSAKIIIMLRNPIDQMYSLYSQNLFSRRENLSFEEALRAESVRKKGQQIPFLSKSAPCHLFYKDVARYTQQVKRYFNLFGRANVKIVLFEDFISNTSQVYKDILSFLDVDNTFQPSKFKKINANKEVRSKTFQKIYQLPVLTRFARYLLPSRAYLKVSRWISNLNAKKTERKPISHKTRCSLIQEFKPEIRALSKLLQKDLTHWLK